MMTSVNTTLGPRPTVNLDPNNQTRVISMPLSNAAPDSPQILDTMYWIQRQYGQSPFIREFTVSILPNTVGNNQIERAANSVADFVRQNVRYLKDPNGIEYLISPIYMINLIRSGKKATGDCDDHVLLLNSMLESIGIEARPVGVKLFDPQQYDHVITQALLPGGWKDFDPCVKNGGQPLYGDRLVVARETFFPA